MRNRHPVTRIKKPSAGGCHPCLRGTSTRPVGPWRAAWRAYRDPAGRWWSPLAAWVEAVERIAFGPQQSANCDGERDGPRV